MTSWGIGDVHRRAVFGGFWGELEEVAAVLRLKILRHDEDLDVEAAVLKASKVEVRSFRVILR